MTCKISPKWRNFSKSGHPDGNPNTYINAYSGLILCSIKFSKIDNFLTGAFYIKMAYPITFHTVP